MGVKDTRGRRDEETRAEERVVVKVEVAFFFINKCIKCKMSFCIVTVQGATPVLVLYYYIK